MKLLLSNWMRDLDAEAIETIGIPSIVLMENASGGAADCFAGHFPLSDYKHIIVLAGKGNNGGDGIAIGRIMHQMGYDVTFLLLAHPDKMNPDPKINFDIIVKLKRPYNIVDSVQQFNTLFDSFAAYPKNETVVVDALFGTGLNKPVSEGLFSETIDRINNSGFKIAAVDLPSGLSEAFLPEEGPHITADVTATFQCLKAAHIHPDGNAHCGEITVVDIGIPKELLKNEKYYIDITTADDCRELMKKSAVDAHKGSFGHGLTIAGSIDKPGAGILSSFSLLRSGAGLCTAAVPKENRLASILGHPELMTLIYKDIRELTDAVSGGKFDVVLAGPGMGNTPATGAVLSMLLEKTPNGQPLVLDADALNALAEGAGVSKKIPMGKGPIILTPHPGEFSRLTGLTAAEIKRDRIALAREFAVKNRLFLVLKGHHTITATPAGRVFLNPTGNPGMATAGSGDVLGGIIAGMLCRYGKSQTVDLILRTAVFVHGLAGDMAAREKGEISLTASDIIDYIPRAFTALQSPSYNHEYTGSINFA